MKKGLKDNIHSKIFTKKKIVYIYQSKADNSKTITGILRTKEGVKCAFGYNYMSILETGA